jgi:hypothetical protein
MIESVSEEVPGITGAEVKAKQRQLIVQHEQPIDEARLVTALAQAGYVVHR